MKAKVFPLSTNPRHYNGSGSNTSHSLKPLLQMLVYKHFMSTKVALTSPLPYSVDRQMDGINSLSLHSDKERNSCL